MLENGREGEAIKTPRERVPRFYHVKREGDPKIAVLPLGG
jgi:hypothetical protein